ACGRVVGPPFGADVHHLARFPPHPDEPSGAAGRSALAATTCRAPFDRPGPAEDRDPLGHPSGARGREGLGPSDISRAHGAPCLHLVIAFIVEGILAFVSMRRLPDRARWCFRMATCRDIPGPRR